MTCAKTQGFLAKHKVSVTEQADAKKATIKGEAALGVLDGVDELYVDKGKKVEHVDLKKAKPDRATLLGLLLGPTGNLRAATLRKGKTLIVGFAVENYKKLLREGARRCASGARRRPTRSCAARGQVLHSYIPGGEISECKPLPRPTLSRCR